MRSRFRPSHGTVVAYLALFVALGGNHLRRHRGQLYPRQAELGLDAKPRSARGPGAPSR